MELPEGRCWATGSARKREADRQGPGSAAFCPEGAVVDGGTVQSPQSAPGTRAAKLSSRLVIPSR